MADRLIAIDTSELVKGVIPVALGPLAMGALAPGPNGRVLAADTTAPSGLAWVEQTGGSGDGEPGPPGPPGGFELQQTIDGGTLMQVVTYDDGTVRAIPSWAEKPLTPSAPTTTTGSDAVLIEWTIPSDASYVVLLRDGVQVYSGSGNSYRDRDVAAMQSYEYSLVSFSEFGWRSNAGPSTAGYADPALNVPPEAILSTWPSPLPLHGRGVVRLAATDLEGQPLTYSSGANNGTLTPTEDPSVWIYTAIER